MKEYLEVKPEFVFIVMKYFEIQVGGRTWIPQIHSSRSLTSIMKSARRISPSPLQSVRSSPCGNEAMNATVCVYICPADHAIITKSERVGGLCVGEGNPDNTRLGLSFVCALVGFNVLREKTLSGRGEADNV